MNRLRVCLDARLISGESGGIEQVVIGLASAFSSLSVGYETYSFLAYEGHTDWIAPHLRGSCELVTIPLPRLRAVKRCARNFLGTLPGVDSARRAYRRLSEHRKVEVPKSDGFVEQMGFDVVHFTTQAGFITGIPTIYQPHDLLHLKAPEYYEMFKGRERDVNYRALCSQAALVAVMTKGARDDLSTFYRLPQEKVAVVPWASVLQSYEPPDLLTLQQTKSQFGLPDTFAFYPAQTWPHKNHIALLEALAILRDRDSIRVSLVASGKQNEHFPAIRRRMRDLSLESQVQFLGFVSTTQLRALYKLATLMVFPSRHEGWGLPLSEALTSGLPIACSGVTAMPVVTGNAALFFDPDKPEEIALRIKELITSPELRNELAERGMERMKQQSWVQTAKIFRAHYRSIGRRLLTFEDHALVSQSMAA